MSPQPLAIIRYVGGKYKQLPWLLPLLPEAQVYCEPFGGSAAVLINRARSPVEVYNDVSRNTTNLLRVLQCPDQAAAMAEFLRMMPYHWQDYMTFRDLDDLPEGFDLAWRYYLRARQSRFGVGSIMMAGWGADLKFTEELNGPAINVKAWWRSLENIVPAGKRLQGVTIERGSALDVIRKYDSPRAFFYLDPPYVMSSRQNSTTEYYDAGEMTDADHTELLDCLDGIQGRWVLSGYDNPLYAERMGGRHIFRPPARATTLVNDKKDRSDVVRQEVVWGSEPFGGRTLFCDAAA